MTQTQTEVDAHDQQDADAVEAAIAIAIADALAHPPDARLMTAHRAEVIMEAAVGISLRFYAHRVLQAFIEAWTGMATPTASPTCTGLSVDRVYSQVQTAVDAGVRRAIDYTGESVRDIIDAAKARADRPSAGPLGRGGVVEQGYNDLEAEAFNRLKVGMESISRILTTRTREEVKLSYATALGSTGCAWRTRRDGKVRNSHADLEGDFVRIGEPFITVNNVALKRPGDPDAPLYETINCRCRLSYRMPV